MTTTSPEIIAREQAYWHGFGRSVTEEARPLSGVDKILMPDESITYGCQKCSYINESMKSVQTHLTKHSTKGYGVNRYDPTVIGKILTWEKMERARSVRGWGERVAARLTKANIPTLSGEPWRSVDVQTLAQRYRDEVPEHDAMALLSPVLAVAQVASLVTSPDTPKIIDAVTQVAKEVTARGGLFNLDADLRARMAETTDPSMTEKIIHDLVNLLGDQARAAKPCGHDDYEDLKAKAAMLDQMRSFMGEGK